MTNLNETLREFYKKFTRKHTTFSRGSMSKENLLNNV